MAIMNTTSRITSPRNGSRLSSWLGALALSALLGTVSHAALAAELVVVEATGVSLEAGASLDAAKPLKLPEGAHVTLITEDGATIKLAGPFDGVPTAAAGGAQGVGAALGGLVASRAADTANLGAVRAGDVAAPLPAPWVVDATRAGDVCIMTGAPAVLWRPKAEAETVMALMPADRSWNAEAPWPKDAALLQLPEDVPFVDGGTFVVEMDGNRSPLTVHIMPASVKSPKMVAAWLEAKGCARQRSALVKVGG
jgi:hypothetical protein